MAERLSQVDEPIYLIEPLLSTKGRNEKFHLLLKACNEQQALACKSDNKVRSVVSTINARLNELNYRSCGIQLLKTLLTQCSDSVFVENCLSWMTQCLRAVANEQSADEACGVLCLLIEMSHHFQELTKPVTGQIIPKLLESILRYKKSTAALQCLEVVLHHYPGPCKAKVKIIEKFLLMFLDEEEKTLVEYASRCMCYLPVLLTAGKNDGKPWTDMLTELCATASSLMYELFENVHEVAVPPALTELPVGFRLKTLKIDSPVLSVHHIATRLINVFAFIEGMLLGDLPNVKAVRDDLLISLTYRVLAVNCNMVSRGKTMEHVALVCVLPDVHMAGINLLQTLVSCCNGGLVKYGPLFCKLVLQTLKWTKTSCAYGVERPFRHLREVAYKFLESWVTRAKGASCVELICEDLITQMLHDVYQKKESVTLQFQEKGKSAEKQLPQIRQQLADPKVNSGPCEAALCALTAIIQCTGSLLGPNLHMRLQEVVIVLLLDIKLSCGPKEMPAPYSVSGCRMQLYRLLLALSLHPHPRWPPPTQFALMLFPLGQNDCSLEVVGFCNLAVACIRQMVHPSQSTHQFPISVDEMRASVGLSNLEAVRGVDLKIQNRQDTITIVETKMADQDSRIVDTEESQQSPLPREYIERNSAQLSDKPRRKKPRTSVSEVSLNGRDSSPNTSSNSSKSQKKKRRALSALDNNKSVGTNSDKLNKKKQHFHFTVEELISSPDKSKTNDGQVWEVTDVVEVNKKESEKKSAKSAKTLETPVGTKRLRSSPKDDERPKIRKLDESPTKHDELNNRVLRDHSHDSKTVDNSETINVEPNISENDIVEKESSEGIVSEVKTVETKILEQDKTKDVRTEVIETEGHENAEREPENEKKKTENEKEESENEKKESENEKEESENEKKESENEKREPKGSSPKKQGILSNDSTLMSSPDKSNCSIVKVKDSSKSPNTSDSKSEVDSPKETIIVVDLHPSSDSETEKQKRASGMYRRITRSIAKRTSTPQHSSGQYISQEELPSSQDSITSEMLNDINRLEEESMSAAADPCVELAESDESAPMVLHIDSDRESVEIIDATNDKTDNQAAAAKEKDETIASVKEESTSGKPNTSCSKNLKDSVTSDREMEEVTEEMEAVVDSPDVTIEEVSPCSDKENAAKKSSKDTEDGSGSETNEEEVLVSFVDALQPK